MKILLIQPLHEKRGGEKRQLKWRKTSFKRRFNPPLGLLYIGTILSRAGHDVEIWDIHGENLLWHETVERIKTLSVDLVGISALSSQYLYVKNLIPIIKEYIGSPVVLGNTLATYNAELVLKKTAVDFCVIGEGENTIIDLIKNIDSPEMVPGIAYRDKWGRLKFTPSRPYIKDVSAIAFPDYGLLDMSRYSRHIVKMVGTRTNNITRNIDRYDDLLTGYVVTGRGCPYRCEFCSRNFRNVRMRAVENVMEEVENLKYRFGISYIHFGDELFVLNKKRTIALCNALKKAGIKWDCQGRINLVDRELLSLMKESGCVTIGYGIESGSQRMLDAMKKEITVDQIKEVMQETMALDLEIKVQLMFGFPGEDLESLQETIDLFKELGHPGRRMTFFTVFPGTDIYDRCVCDGTIPDEDAYLSALEMGAGWGQVLLNFSSFPDEEIWPRIRHAARVMRANVLKGSERLTALEKANFRFLMELERNRLGRPLKKNEKVMVKNTIEPIKHSDKVSDLPTRIVSFKFTREKLENQPTPVKTAKIGGPIKNALNVCKHFFFR